MNCCRSVVLATAVVAVAAGGQGLKASDDDHRAAQSVTLSFGAGLNTAGAANHHILPGVTKVRTKLATATTAAVPGVVNFVVGGFHQIFVYNPGVTPDDIKAFLAANDPTNANLFINNLNNLYYTGINPYRVVMGVFTQTGNDPNGVNPPPPIPPASPVRDGFQNRTESVGFTVPGLYLVICNVRPHFQDGMIAWVKVVADDDDDDHGHEDHE